MPSRSTPVFPSLPIGLIVLVCDEAHGSRDHDLAGMFQRQGFATWLVALQRGPAEDLDALGDRLATLLCDLVASGDHHNLPIGLFGCEEAASAALVAAMRRPELVAAVVAHGGRPDLVIDALPRVHAPTLFVLGSGETAQITLHRDAARQLLAKHEVALVSGARRGLAQPGVLDEVAVLSGRWFSRYFVSQVWDAAHVPSKAI